uniref:Ig-like domain-containing protein n=1 Tax=Oreochromis aureus TaxID=47969 RepID=A0AAZ1XCU7_OREAU
MNIICHILMFLLRISPTFNLSAPLFHLLDQKTTVVKSGQDVTLTCRAPNSILITAVKWSRADLEPQFVLLFQDSLFDRQMKDGDVSLILNNVKINDAETYMCRVFIEETRSWKNSIIIYLTVVDPPGE